MLVCLPMGVRIVKRTERAGLLVRKRSRAPKRIISDCGGDGNPSNSKRESVGDSHTITLETSTPSTYKPPPSPHPPIIHVKHENRIINEHTGIGVALSAGQWLFIINNFPL